MSTSVWRSINWKAAIMLTLLSATAANAGNAKSLISSSVCLNLAKELFTDPLMSNLELRHHGFYLENLRQPALESLEGGDRILWETQAAYGNVIAEINREFVTDHHELEIIYMFQSDDGCRYFPAKPVKISVMELPVGQVKLRLYRFGLDDRGTETQLRARLREALSRPY